jgi:serine phosphatase RsbU (regulator of sigma subunit)
MNATPDTGTPAARHIAPTPEMRSAREVLSRLLPREAPHLETLEYAGCTMPARTIGGDYYDFLQPEPGHLALALGDISGKGISGALMMASLQASLRSHYATATNDLAPLLRSVNHLFCACTALQHYASLVLAHYDDAGRRLRYVNCGHVPPLLLRRDGGVDRLVPTATLLGAFEEWDCGIGEVTLAPGDLLLLYTDGVTEARDRGGLEFGEERLAATLRRCSRLPAEALIGALLRTVREFTVGPQSDDVTLVVARARQPVAVSPDRAVTAR